MDAKRLAVALCVFCTLLACSDSAETLPSVSNEPISVNSTPEPVTANATQDGLVEPTPTQ